MEARIDPTDHVVLVPGVRLQSIRHSTDPQSVMESRCLCVSPARGNHHIVNPLGNRHSTLANNRHSTNLTSPIG
jgi:hypothetical protein